MERRASVSLWPACPVTVSQRRVAIEVAGLAVWAEALPETKLTDEQVPFPLSTPASAGRWIGAPSARIFPSACIHSLTLIRICPLCPPVDGVDKVDNGGQVRNGPNVYNKGRRYCSSLLPRMKLLLLHSTSISLREAVSGRIKDAFQDSTQEYDTDG